MRTVQHIDGVKKVGVVLKLVESNSSSTSCRGGNYGVLLVTFLVAMRPLSKEGSFNLIL